MLLMTERWASGVERALTAAANADRAERARRLAQRVSIQQAIGRLTDDIEEEGPLSDGERSARLLATADDVILAYHGQGTLSDALLWHLAEGQAWLEVLEQEASR